MLVDSHCHLDFMEANGADLDETVARAGRAGVGTMVTICTKMTEAAAVKAVADRFDNVFCSVGVHPQDVDSEPAVTAAEIEALTNDPKVVGIGETGLDYYYENSPRAAQQRSFAEHIQASQRTGLPVIVHTRDADEDTVNILTSAFREKPFSGVIHCFTGGAQLAEKAVEIGFCISFSGILTFKNASDLRDIAAKVPMDKLLVETDAPYLAPVPKRGKPNEPSYVVHTAELLAEIKGVSSAEMARITTDNFYRLFAKAAPVS